MQVERQRKLLKEKTFLYRKIDGFRQLANTVQRSCEVDANNPGLA
jgi:hypothetical protein